MGRLRSFRKKRRPGNRKPTDAEELRILFSKVGPCIACLIRFEGKHRAEQFVIFGGEYNHVKSGNIRIGHGAGYCMCQWHHKGHAQPGTPQEHMGPRMLERVYGPSLADGSRLFQDTYGTHEQLIEKQTQVVEELMASGVDVYGQQW